jgi:hypothetical protein
MYTSDHRQEREKVNFFLFVFCGTRVWNQMSELAKQVQLLELHLQSRSLGFFSQKSILSINFQPRLIKQNLIHSDHFVLSKTQSPTSTSKVTNKNSEGGRTSQKAESAEHQAPWPLVLLCCLDERHTWTEHLVITGWTVWSLRRSIHHFTLFKLRIRQKPLWYLWLEGVKRHGSGPVSQCQIKIESWLITCHFSFSYLAIMMSQRWSTLPLVLLRGRVRNLPLPWRLRSKQL